MTVAVFADDTITIHRSGVSFSADLGELAARLIVVGLHGDVTDLAQAQGIRSGNLLFQAAIQALDELNV